MKRVVVDFYTKELLKVDWSSSMDSFLSADNGLGQGWKGTSFGCQKCRQYNNKRFLEWREANPGSVFNLSKMKQPNIHWEKCNDCNRSFPAVKNWSVLP